MQTYALRLHPDQDLKLALTEFARQKRLQAGLVVTCVGSLKKAALRLANQPHTDVFDDKFEILSLVGTLSPDGVHLHISLADGTGKTVGGHLQEGSLIYTTAEIVVGDLRGTTFRREIDPDTGYDELVISPSGTRQQD